MKSEERRMKKVFYLHPDGIILHSTFFILHFIHLACCELALLILSKDDSVKLGSMTSGIV